MRVVESGNGKFEFVGELHGTSTSEPNLTKMMNTHSDYAVQVNGFIAVVMDLRMINTTTLTHIYMHITLTRPRRTSTSASH